MDQILSLMRALADPTRLRIALLIRQLELSVGEVVDILGQSQPRVSRHIRILDEAGLAQRRKEGSWVFLRPGPKLNDGRLDPLLALSDDSDARMMKRDIAKLEEVRAARAKMAATYFAEHAAEWDQLRSLHVAEADVEDAMKRLLTISPLGRVLDVGTGTGRMIELFAGDAAHMTAIDSNSEMLRLARAKLSGLMLLHKKPLSVDIMMGDFNNLPVEDGSFDTILFHQVLHYAQAPERVIAEAARVLAPSGRMMIVDFATHDREELRSVHAHARLGFSDDSILRSFASCGLYMVHSDTLGDTTVESGRLTVKIWLGEKTAQEAAPPNDNIRNPRDVRLRMIR
jgi:ubiquinone/menaquinone biosynthesis C-methylase UbiE/DNA-binding transcriptional ArsR family regulator